MEPSTSGISGTEFKPKQRNSFSENSSLSRDGSASSNGNLWLYSKRRDHGKNRERDREREWNREVAFHGKGRDNFRGEETREREQSSQLPQQTQATAPLQTAAQTPQAAFPSYNFNTVDQHSYVNNRQALSMMSTYGMLTSLNTPWGTVNPMDGMGMNPTNIPVNPNPTTMPLASGMEMTRSNGAGINPFTTHMGLGGDNNMFGMMGMGNYCPYPMMNWQDPGIVGHVKEVVTLTKSVLYPPNANAPPPPTRRGKPLGCKTVFVGGLPDKITEEIVREVFERCGEILTIRMSKKNFCHIRFSAESFVENAMYFSGYRIKIENKDEPAYTGRLHVDYAQARDDQYDYECQQRALQREARHRERMEQEFFRPPTPPPVVHYSEHEATVLGEKLRGEETFQHAVFVLITWLERGECNKRNAGSFYSMIQSTNSHVRRLMNEKLKYEDELNKARMMLKEQMRGILIQFSEICEVFNTASLQKIWDNFTKAQRRNIEMWKKQTEEIKNAHTEEVLNDRIEDEMNISEDEETNDDNLSKKIAETNDQQKEKYCQEVNKLREEIDALLCELEAAENETMALKSDLEFKERHIEALKQALQSSTKEMTNINQKHSADEAEFRAFKFRKENENQDVKTDHSELKSETSANLNSSFNENEAHLVVLVSTLLLVQPFGANIHYICSYLNQIDSTIQPRDVENLMKRIPSIFREYAIGIGASSDKKWKFIGFQFAEKKN